MKQEHVHHYVIEHIAGSLKARKNTKRLLVAMLAVTSICSLIVFLTRESAGLGFGVVVATFLAGVPLGVAAQRTTLRLALSRDSLRLKRFLIGKKGYIAPRSHVLHDQADLFSVAANLVCYEPRLAPNSNAAAWHTYGVLGDVPGVAVCTGWYGDATHTAAFLYGDYKSIAEISDEIWDLGHIRKITSSDKERLVQTAVGWRRQKLLPVALAYAALPAKADPFNIRKHDIAGSTTLLGGLGLEGSRGGKQTIPLTPVASVNKAVYAQVIVSIALGLYAAVSAIMGRFADVAVPVNTVHLLIFSLFIMPIVLAVTSWDHASKSDKKERISLGSLIWVSGLITFISYGAYLLYIYWQGSLNVTYGSIVHQAGATVGLLTFGLSVLVYMTLSRIVIGKRSKTPHNPLFLLAWASALLMILIVAYVSGPLLPGGIIMAMGMSIVFGSIYELYAHANRHHTREHILELLESTRL